MASLIRRKRTKKTEIEFALDLGERAVVLYERGPFSGWKKFASAELDDPEFSVVIGLLRNEAEAYSGLREPVRLWLPPSQVLKRRAEITGKTPADRLLSAFDYLRLQTSYRPEDVAIAVAPEPRDGKTTVLITFAETWREARSYAKRWGFVPGDVSTRSFAADFGTEGPTFLPEGYQEEKPVPLSRGRLHLAAAAVAVAVTGASAWTLHPQLTDLVGGLTGKDGVLTWVTQEVGDEPASTDSAEIAPSTPASQDEADRTTFSVTANDVTDEPGDPKPADAAAPSQQPAEDTAKVQAQDPTLSLSATDGGEPQQASPFDLAAPAHVPTVPTLDPNTASTSAPEIGRGPAKLAALAAPADLGSLSNPGSLPARPPSPVAPNRAPARGSSWTDLPGLKSPDEALPQLASLDLAKSGSGEILHSTDLDLLGSAGAIGKPPLAVPLSLPRDVKTAAPPAMAAASDDLAPRIAPEVRTKLDDVLTVTEPPLQLASVAPLAGEPVNHPDITPSAASAAPLPMPKPTADLVEPSLAPAPATPVARLPPADADLILAQAPDTVPVLPAPKPPIPPGPEAPLSQLPEQQPDPNDMTPTALAVQEAPPPPLKPRSEEPAATENVPPEDALTDTAASATETTGEAAEGAATSDADALAGVTSDGDELAGEESLEPTDLAVEAAPLPPLKPWNAKSNEPVIAAAPQAIADLPAPSGPSPALTVIADAVPSASAPGEPDAPAAGTAGALALADLPEIDHPTADMEPTALAIETGPLPPRKPVTGTTGTSAAARAETPETAAGEGLAEVQATTPADAPTDATVTTPEAGATGETAIDTAEAPDAETADDFPVTVIPDLATAMAELRVPAPRPDGVFRSADGSLRSLSQIPPRPRPARLDRQSENADPEPAPAVATAAPEADAVGQTPGARTAEARSSVPVTVTGTDPLRGLVPDQAAPQAEEDPDAPTQYASLSAPLPKTRPAQRALPKTLPSIALPKISPQSVQEAATDQGLPLDKVTLIGILDLESGRRALLRLPNGRYRSVVLGDVLDGWRVSLIGRDAMRVTRSGEDRTLLLVSR
ncbi:MAG: hypothetical protein OEN23_05435 [Paracoccaceae bacterium]|nr:hypothetical protein [Paracoccaceae bacterium]